jgi:error-prone DNA polymerase
MDVELHCHSYYSFLEGASAPEELVAVAAELGLRALALTDRHGLYGAPGFIRACRNAGIRPLLGAELCGWWDATRGLLADPDAGLSEAQADRWLILARSDEGMRQLSCWLTRGHRDQPKDKPKWLWSHLKETAVDQLHLLLGAKGSYLARLIEAEKWQQARGYVECVRQAWPASLWIELNHHEELGDDERCEGLRRLADELGLPMLIGGQVRYAHPQQGSLFDVLQAIRQRVRLSKAKLPTNHQAHLKAPDQLQRLWQRFPEAVAASVAFAEQSTLSFDLRKARLPEFPTPKGLTPDAFLSQLCWEAFHKRNRPEQAIQLRHELALIQKLGLAGYFLVVWDLVAFARREGIPVQGRGSAANSMVAFLLGITPVDPVRHRLFLGRFLHEGMTTLPDIDLDFASDRDHELPCREKVIQYVYDRYGADHVAMVCTYVTFQERSAVREVGSVMEMPPVWLEQLARLTGHRRLEEAVEEVSKDPEAAQWFASHHGQQVLQKIEQILGIPRHLGIHVGGMLISASPLAEVVPLENARMEDRVVCQWDKEQIEDAGLIKVDLLGLGMLGVIREACLLAQIAPEQIPDDDLQVYDMLSKADTVGVFQVESRAQMQSLPQTEPQNLSELAIQVALIRPGPLQGQMVSPYIRRKRGEEQVRYLHPLTEPILEETLGVILYQEQVLQVAIAVAGFTPEQADDLRRSISRKRSKEAFKRLHTLFVSGAAARGIGHEISDQVFSALEGFALYGFCKSHALAFAHLTAQSAFLKCHYPAAFLAALLNHQPMGFYGPEILIQDAQRHGVRVLPVDIEQSQSHCFLEQGAVRLGFNQVQGWSRQLHEPLLARARREGPLRSFVHFLSLCPLPFRTVEGLILAGALDRFGERRALLWQLWHGQRVGIQQPDLFGLPDAPLELPRASWLELRQQETQVQGLSLREHPLQRLRPHLGFRDSSCLCDLGQDQPVALIGRVVVRQKPPTAKGFAFLTLDDEAGLWNVVVRPDLYRSARQTVRLAPYLLVEGVIQRRRGVIHVFAESLEPFCVPERNERPDG